MSEKKVSSVTPIEDFAVHKKHPHKSDFDEEAKRKK